MKLNWGFGIALLYIGFVAMMLYLVYLSVQQDHPLVTENYYEKDLKYNEQITRMTNTKNLPTPVEMVYNANGQKVVVQFPTQFKAIKGEILAFRPSQDGLDFTLPISVDTNNRLEFSSAEMLHGLWKLKITWSGDETPFFQEMTLMVQNPKSLSSKK